MVVRKPSIMADQSPKYKLDAVDAAPWTSVIETFALIRNCQSASTAGRASGAFVVASLNFEIVVSVRGAMIAVVTFVTFLAHTSAGRSRGGAKSANASPWTPCL